MRSRSRGRGRLRDAHLCRVELGAVRKVLALRHPDEARGKAADDAADESDGELEPGHAWLGPVLWLGPMLRLGWGRGNGYG